LNFLENEASDQDFEVFEVLDLSVVTSDIFGFMYEGSSPGASFQTYFFG